MKKRVGALFLALSLACLLVVSAGAVETSESLEIDESMVETIADMYENESVCQIFDGQGNDITAAFLAQHRASFEAENYGPIVEDIIENDVSLVLPVVEMMGPRLIVNNTVSAQLSMSYVVNGTAYTARAKLQITSQINDSDNQFVSVSNGILTNITKGYASAVVSGGGYSSKIDGNGKRFSQQAKFTVQVGTLKETSNWSAVAWAGQNTLNCTKISQTGDL